MTIVGENNTDIMLDPNGQPVSDSSGDFKIVSGDACGYPDRCGWSADSIRQWGFFSCTGYRMLAAGYPKRNGYSRR